MRDLARGKAPQFCWGKKFSARSSNRSGASLAEGLLLPHGSRNPAAMKTIKKSDVINLAPWKAKDYYR